MASNGVIHGIEEVLLPDGFDLDAFLDLCDHETEQPTDPPTSDPDSEDDPDAFGCYCDPGDKIICPLDPCKENVDFHCENMQPKIGPKYLCHCDPGNIVHCNENASVENVEFFCVDDEQLVYEGHSGDVECGSHDHSEDHDHSDDDGLLNIVDTAIKNHYDKFVEALVAAGLADGLMEKDDLYTVFAPNDKAFAYLKPKALPCLLRPENIDILTDVLQTHVVAGDVITSSDLNVGETFVTAMSGQVLDIDKEEDDDHGHDHNHDGPCHCDPNKNEPNGWELHCPDAEENEKEYKCADNGEPVKNDDHDSHSHDSHSHDSDHSSEEAAPGDDD